jgi:hypothetical protein
MEDGGVNVKIWDDSGTLKSASALPMVGPPGGIRTDGQGNILIVVPFQRQGQACPAGLDPAAPLASKAMRNEGFWGTLFKFAPGHGRIRGAFGAKWDYPATPPTHSWGGIRIWVEDYLWDYPGVSKITGLDNSCACPHGRFDLDDFGRAFVPQTYLHSVRVLDPNGNNVLRIGRYGNLDCQGPKSMFPEPDIGLTYPNLVAASDTAAYIADPGNSRILKAALSYAAEEVVPAP